MIEVDIRSPVLSRLLPSTGVDTVVHCGIVWYPEPDKPAAGAARHQRDRDAAAARRLREDRRAGAGRRPRLGRDLRLRARGAVVLHRGDGAESPAADAVPARHRRARGLLRELRPPARHAQLLHAPLPARARRRRRDAALPLPVAAGRPDPARLRPAPAAAARRRRHRGAARGDARPGPRRRQRRPDRLDLADPGPAPARPAARCRFPHPLFGPALARAGRRLGVGGLYGDAVRLLRYGRGVDNRRLREELGYEPRFDAVAADPRLRRAQRRARLAPLPGLGAALGRIAGEPR